MLRAICASLVASWMLAVPALADPAEANQQIGVERTTVYGVFFHSVNCGVCHILEPKLEAALERMGDDAPTIEYFDLTFAGLGGAVADRAEALGVADIYAENGNATGYVMVMNGKTGEPITRLGVGYSVDQLAEILRVSMTHAPG